MGMNTILAGIALCLLLLASPVAASDYTLGIFGNANEDDTINMQDVTYTELIILEYRDRTELADAKYDGEIDILDMTQIALIILGREKELTLVDGVDRAVTVNIPIERIVGASTAGPARTFRALGAVDKLVGINGMIKKDAFYPELHDLPSVGWPGPDYEAIVALEPDVVIAGRTDWEYVEKLEPLGIPVVLYDCAGSGTPSEYYMELRIYGIMLGNTERAEEYINFLQSDLDIIEERTNELKPEEKKTVYYEFQTRGYWIIKRYRDAIRMAGGIDIFDDLFSDDPQAPSSFIVDPEAVIDKDPDVIIRDPHPGNLWSGYSVGVVDRMKELREETLERPGWSDLQAVKNDEVYIVSREFGNERAIGICFLAKLLSPDLFPDLDCGAKLEEYVEKYHGKDYEDYQVVVYHPTRFMR